MTMVPSPAGLPLDAASEPECSVLAGGREPYRSRPHDVHEPERSSPQQPVSGAEPERPGPDDPEELFDEPSQWRAGAVADLGLHGEDRCAGASTSVAMPELVGRLAELVALAPRGVGVDIGGGLGSLSAWLRDRAGQPMVPIEPSLVSCRGARQLFGLEPVRAGATDLPVADEAASMAVLNGVVSLLDDLDGAVREAVRVTAPGGLVVVADLTAPGSRRLRAGPNVFWSAPELVDALGGLGCAVEHVACAKPGVGSWAPIQQSVTDEIERRHVGRPGFDVWARDGRRLTDLIDVGAIAATSLIARRQPG